MTAKLLHSTSSTNMTVPLPPPAAFPLKTSRMRMMRKSSFGSTTSNCSINTSTHSIMKTANNNNKPEQEGATAGENPRIPLSLQAVFLASNRGEEVSQPPPDKTACRVFFRSFSLRTPSMKFRKSQRSASNSVSDVKNKSPSTLASPMKSNPTSVKDNTDDDAIPPHIRSRIHEQKLRSACSEKVLNNNSHMSRSSSGSITTSSHKRRSSLSQKLPTLSPQSYLDAMLKSRGYSTQHYDTLRTAYYNKPTELQQASYHSYLIDLVRQGDIETFDSVMKSGISLNPCNAHGESLVHMVCRRGDIAFLRNLVDLGCRLQVSDDYGRTPLHDACWTVKPCFDVVALILHQDRRLFYMADCRGALPLSYVRPENWAAWLEFLQAKKDVFWPHRTTTAPEGDPHLAQLGACTCPLPNPERSLTPDLCAMVASGKLTPAEAEYISLADDDDDESDDDSDCDGDVDDSEVSFVTEESSESSFSSLDDDDLNLVKELVMEHFGRSMKDGVSDMLSSSKSFASAKKPFQETTAKEKILSTSASMKAAGWSIGKRENVIR